MQSTLEDLKIVIRQCGDEKRASQRANLLEVLSEADYALLDQHYKQDRTAEKDAELCALFNIGMRSRRRFLDIPSIYIFVRDGVPANIAETQHAAHEKKTKKGKGDRKREALQQHYRRVAKSLE